MGARGGARGGAYVWVGAASSLTAAAKRPWLHVGLFRSFDRAAEMSSSQLCSFSRPGSICVDVTQRTAAMLPSRLAVRIP